MPRPLVWVGVAYTLGAAWAAGGQNIFCGIAGIAFCMWITGRIRQSWTGMWLFWFLPVFFVSGFVIFSHSMQEIRDDTSENQSTKEYMRMLQSIRLSWDMNLQVIL